jgi:hypothetical protein
MELINLEWINKDGSLGMKCQIEESQAYRLINSLLSCSSIKQLKITFVEG